MRTLTVACLTICVLFQTGCTLAPKLTMQSASRPNQKASEKYLAARRLESQGKYELARERYRELLDKHPKNPDYLHRLGVVCTQLQRFAEAERYYERARKQDPKNAPLLADMGYSYYIKGDQVTSERLLRDALNLKPSDKKATSNLALVVGDQGKTEEALTLLREVGDEASALAGLAYIHMRRGEADLAEQRYRDALALNPALKDAIDGLARIDKQKKLDETLLAKAATEKAKADAKADPADATAKTDEIQQAIATKSANPKAIKLANFSDEWLDLDEPRKLVDKEEASELEAPEDSAEVMAFDDEPSMDDELMSDNAAKIPQKQIASSEGWNDDDIAIGEPVTASKPRRTSTVVPAGLDLFDGGDDPFAPSTSQSNRPSSAPPNSGARKPKLLRTTSIEMDEGKDQ